MAEDSANDSKLFNFQGDDSNQGGNQQDDSQNQQQGGTTQNIDPAYNYSMNDSSQNQGTTFTINADGSDANPAPAAPQAAQPSQPTPSPVTPPPAPQAPGATGPTPPPAGATTGTGTTPPPPPIPKDEGDPANFNIAKYIPKNVNIKVPAHNLQFDEAYFLELLAGSISLTRDEKKRIIDSIPKLRQEQIDELIRIFEEERKKFAELSDKHVPQLEKLAKQHALDWESLQSKEVEEEKASEDQAKMDDIKKNLGLN